MYQQEMYSPRLPNLLVLLVLLGIVGGLRWLLHMTHGWEQAAWFVAGMWLGIFMLVLEERVFFPKLMQSQEMTYPPSRSALFLLLFVPVAFFVITTSGSLFGSGFALGMGYVLAFEQLQARSDGVLFNQSFFQPLKRSLSLQQIQFIAFGFLAIVLVLTAMVMR
jgi:hypothetical protein